MKRTFLICLLLWGCTTHTASDRSGDVVSMQILDRNGFSETISSKDRLANYHQTDFLQSQPYQKVLRVFGKDIQGKTVSKITSYHPNGQIAHYLEAVDGRAHGVYKEWYPNGTLKLEATVIDGTADINEMAQINWLFDGKSTVWDEAGNRMAEICYEKGALHGPSMYYHPNGKLARSIPYHNNEIDGSITVFDEAGGLLERTEFLKGLKQGTAFGYFDETHLSYREEYDQDLLKTATYYNLEGVLISEINNGGGKQAVFKDRQLFSLVQFRHGIPEGKVEIFDDLGRLSTSYMVKNGKKNGEEWQYYDSQDDKLSPKLFLTWRDDEIQGTVKTWYENGVLESQRELNGNKKQGLALAWFKEGDLMLMEEYEDDHLIKGSYFKKWDNRPVSRVEGGKGLATFYDNEGRFLRKVTYDKGRPQGE
jgi:antitoxin component YwqK of YwqJK toxin-antitoxin module